MEHDWKQLIIASFSPAQPDDDVVEELAQHAAATYETARAEGCSVADAQRRVDEQIAAWTRDPGVLTRRPRRLSAVVPPAASGNTLATVLQDARYALRLMRRQPAYTALVVATMALGIAATTVLGSVAYGVLLKPLPWADASRLVRLYETRRGATGRFRPMMTNISYLAWNHDSATMEAFGAWSGGRATLTGAGEPERIQIAHVTPSLLPMLQARPLRGRLFVNGDEQPGHETLLILSEGFWRQRFGARDDVIGRSVELDGSPVTIVGVLPASFTFFDRETRGWQPLVVPPVIDPKAPDARHIALFSAIGRLRPGVTPAQAAAEGSARGSAVKDVGVVAMAVFGSMGDVQVTVKPLLDAMTEEVRPAILVLLAAVALLLATATANVASLQLARAAGRRRELAIRAALGAGRRRLARQTLVENVVLGVLGGVVGLALAALMQRALPAILPADFPRMADIALGPRVGIGAIALAVVTGMAFGLLPALQAARRDLAPALAEDSLAPVGGSLRTGTARARAVIMAGQVAIASVLLVGALLLARSFVGLIRADTGYDTTNVLTAQLPLDGPGYTPERRLHLLEMVVSRLRQVPGVSAAAYGSMMPFSPSFSLATFPLKKPDGSVERVQTGARTIGPGYFAALGQRLVAGREFTTADADGAQPVAIVNAEFARRFIGRDALGSALPNMTGKADRAIVGVAADAVRKSATDTPQPEIYYPALQQQIAGSSAALAVRTTGDPRALVPTLRSIVREQDPNVTLDQVATLEDLLLRSVERPRLYATLLATFAAFALAIAGVGLFGVLSYTVAQRSREIAVRSALGAEPRAIVGLVARQALVIAAGGVAVGLLGAFWAAAALRNFLFGVTAHDPVSFAGVAAVLLVMALAASIIPARRAARIDPVKMLRA